MNIVCDKCEVKAYGLAAHVGRKHKACKPRKKGSGTSYANCGKWKVQS